MYILEIDPPIDKHPEEDITMMPACNVCLIIYINHMQGQNILLEIIKLVTNQFDFANNSFLF